MYYFKAILLVWIVQALFLINAENLDSKIIGGSQIAISQAPWQVSVRLKIYEVKLFGAGHICGGTVISQRVVISAAHCVANTDVTPAVYRKASEYTLVMGSAFLYSKTSNTLEYDVIQIEVTPKFNIATMVHDIALFFINGYIPWDAPTVQSIALNNLALASGTPCNVTGWGETGTGAISQVLESVTVPIVSYAVCSTNYSKLATGMLCAGDMQNGGIDACQGDSGGPLTCNGLLAGIVSWGNGCALPGYPGVYTNVSYFNKWIQITNSSFNYTYYLNDGNNGTVSAKSQISLIAILSGIFIVFLFKY